MDWRKVRQLAKERVDSDPRATGLVAVIYVGAILLLSYLVSYLSQSLSSRTVIVGIGDLEGSAAMRWLRAALLVAASVATPLLGLGYIGCTMKTARGEPVQPGDLLAGFRKFVPAVKLFAWLVLLALGLEVLFILVGAVLAFVIYGLSGHFPTWLLWEAFPLIGACTILVAAIVLTVILLWVVYRLLLTGFLLMDGEKSGRQMIAKSNRLMKGNAWKFFRLELSFWWVWLLPSLLSGISVVFFYDPVIKGLIILASWVLQLIVAYWGYPWMMTAHAVAYDEINNSKEASQEA